MTESIHGDVASTVRVSGQRFEVSPFQDRWLTPESVMGVYAGRYYCAYNGEDVESTYWALRRAAVMYDVPERPVQIAGPDAVRFLEHVLTRTVADLRPGRGRYALACSPSGGLFMDGVLFRLDERTFWFVQPDGPLEAWLLAHSDGYDVTVTDPRSRVLQIQGPASPAILAEATEGQVDQSLRYFHSGFFRIGGQQVYLSRTGWTAELGYEIYTLGDTTDASDATDAGRLWDDLVTAGAGHGMLVGSTSSMEIRRIEAGILDSGTDFDLTMTPYEAGLGAFVDLDKPAFVGRDALTRAGDAGNRLLGIRCPDAAPGYRSPIVDADATVGHVTAGAWSPSMNSGIGYARFDKQGPWEGRELHVLLPDGRRLPCHVGALPFLDPDKRIPRGLPIDAP